MKLRSLPADLNVEVQKRRIGVTRRQQVAIATGCGCRDDVIEQDLSAALFHRIILGSHGILSGCPERYTTFI